MYEGPAYLRNVGLFLLQFYNRIMYFIYVIILYYKQQVLTKIFLVQLDAFGVYGGS